MKKILLAGATGYLGNFILKELLDKGFEVKIIVRNQLKIPKTVIDNKNLEIVEAELTKAESIKNCCIDVDTVISTVGITKQKDGLTYMNVDYQANKNLLDEAKNSGAKKFIYVSVFKGAEMADKIKICEAKEKFVTALKASALDYCVIRPTGYFSDMAEFYKLAAKGKVMIFGKGEHKMNPIHGADLAEVCVQAIDSKEKEINVGGPHVLTFNKIAMIAFSVSGKKTKIVHIPIWVGNTALSLMKIFTGSKTYGPFEFFLTVISTDMVAPEYGSHQLRDFFLSLKG